MKVDKTILSLLIILGVLVLTVCIVGIIGTIIDEQPAIRDTGSPAAEEPVAVVFDVTQLGGKTEAEVAKVLGPMEEYENWEDTGWLFVGSPNIKYTYYESPSDKFSIHPIFDKRTKLCVATFIDFLPYPTNEDNLLRTFNVKTGPKSLAWWSGRHDIWLCPEGNIKEYCIYHPVRRLPSGRFGPTDEIMTLNVIFHGADYDFKGKELE